MARSLPPLTWFRTFEASARHLNFTAAAQELGLTQSAVSQQIKSLETRLKTSLFTRRARGLALTDEGRRLLPTIETALNTLTQATDTFATRPAKTSLTIAASVSLLQWVISPNLTAFSSQYPEVNIHFKGAIWSDEFSAVRADVEIRFASEKQAGADAKRLCSDRLIAVRAPAYNRPIEQSPLIDAVGVSSGWGKWGLAAGMSDLRPSFSCDSYGVALQMAADGAGIALTSEYLAQHGIRSGRLIRAHEHAIPALETYFLIRNTDTPAARAFCDWIQSL